MKAVPLILIGLLVAAPLRAGSFLSYERQAGSDQRLLGETTPKEGAAKPGEPQSTTPLNLEALKKVEAQLAKGEIGKALALLQTMELQGADKALLEQRHALLMRAQTQAGRLAAVVALGREGLQEHAQGPHFGQSYFLFVRALDALHLPLEGTQLVQPQHFDSLAPAQRQLLRDLLVQDALRRAEPLSALRLLEQPDGQLAEGFERWTNEILDRLSDVRQLEQMIQRYQAQGFVEQAQLRRMRLLMRDQPLEVLEKEIGLLLANPQITPQTLAELQALAGQLRNNETVELRRIGVILPFSHPRFSRMADEVMEGLEMSLKEQKRQGIAFELVLKDSEGMGQTPTKARQEVEWQKKDRQDQIKELVRQLAVEERVIAIVGPLAKDSSIAAGEAAEKYKVPLISFSLTEGLGQGKRYLFRYQKSPQAEAQAIANYALDYLQARRFVILYPEGKAGFGKMTAFKNQVESRGGKVVGIAAVGLRQMDFQEDFNAMTGGFRPISDAEQAEIARARDRVDPEVDFDAIYAPLHPAMVNVITNFANLFEADRSWILADHDMNVRELGLVEDASRLRFVDSHAALIADGSMAPLVETHWKVFSFDQRYQPPTDYSLYGYEALEILGQLLAQPANQNRENLTQALREIKALPVYSGAVTCDESGELSKNLHVFAVQGGIPQPAIAKQIRASEE